MTYVTDQPVKLVIIRGLPGSGKTTMARAMSGYKHFEADHFFERSGKYIYDPSQVNNAHIWCAGKVMESLSRRENVVVSNSFSRFFEMEKYLRGAAEVTKCLVTLIEATGNWQNIHSVPDSVIAKMRDRWEQITEADVNAFITNLQK